MSRNSKVKSHPGAHWLLHPEPTRQCDVRALSCQACGADVSEAEQSPCEVYDRVEIPAVVPDVTRVSLHGGTCPCYAKRFKAEAPAGLEPGSPFGPNIRAFVIYLRAVQGIPLARLRDLLLDLFGLSISDGALVNMLAASAKPFRAATSLIKARLSEPDWRQLRAEIEAKRVRIVALDLPTSWSLASPSDEFTGRMFAAVNAMTLDVLAAVARKDYEDRRRRQAEGTAKAKAAGLYKGRRENRARNEGIAAMLLAGSSWQQIQQAMGCSRGTIAKVRQRLNRAATETA